MRFRNYINTNNRRNRIFSEDDIWNMKLSSLFDNEADIMAQNKSIGIPTMQELEQSPYTRKVEDDIIYGDNADAVATWEALLEEIAERIQAPPDISYFDIMKKKKKRRRDEEQDDEQNEEGNNNPMPEQTSEPAESTTESESGEEASEESQETSAEEDASEESSPVVLEGKVEENVDLGKDIPPAVQNPESVDKYENLFPLVYGKYDLQDGINKTVDAKPTLKQKLDSLAKKYEGLDTHTALQKAISKAPIPWSEWEYYSIASKLADNEEQNPAVLEQNDFDKLDNIKDESLKHIYYEKAAQMYGLDPKAKDTYEKLKDVDIVTPKETSRLNKQIKDSEIMQRWVAENYEKIKNGGLEKSSITFEHPSKELLEDEDKRALYGTIKRTDLSNPKINRDGSFSVLLNDGYDFSIMDHKKNESVKTNDWRTDLENKASNGKKALVYNQIVDGNNRAHKQQEAGKLKRYVLSTPINYTQEELEEIFRKYKKNKL